MDTISDQPRSLLASEQPTKGFDLGQFTRKVQHDQVIAQFHACPASMSITDRTEHLSEHFQVHEQTIRRHLKTAKLIGKGAKLATKHVQARSVSSAAAQQVVRAIAPLFNQEDAQAIGEGLAAGLVLSSVINTQRERVRDLSRLVRRLSVQVEHVIGPHLDAVTGQPLPVDPASVHASTRTFASLVAAVSELNAEERRAWGIKEEAGLLSWSETLDQLDRSQVVNGQLVTPGAPAAAAPDPAPLQPSGAQAIEGESRRVDEPAESLKPMNPE